MQVPAPNRPATWVHVVLWVLFAGFVLVGVLTVLVPELQDDPDDPAATPAGPAATPESAGN